MMHLKQIKKKKKIILNQKKNKKEKPLNYLINKNKNININNFLQNDSPSYEHFNPQEIENEYDIYISKLKNQLIKERYDECDTTNEKIEELEAKLKKLQE